MSGNRVFRKEGATDAAPGVNMLEDSRIQLCVSGEEEVRRGGTSEQ